MGKLLKPRKDATEMLDFANEALNQMTFFVQMSVIGVWFSTVSTRRNDWYGTALDNEL
jgi:purine-cytosine permease-like protein